MPAEYQIRSINGFYGPVWRILTMNHQGVWDDRLRLGSFSSKEDAVFALSQYIIRKRSGEGSVAYFDVDGKEIP